jgi:hypothetical protein
VSEKFGAGNVKGGYNLIDEVVDIKIILKCVLKILL